MGLAPLSWNLPFNLVSNPCLRLEWIDQCEFKLHGKHYTFHVLFDEAAGIRIKYVMHSHQRRFREEAREVHITIANILLHQ